MRLQPHLQSKNICVYTIYVNAKSQLFVSCQDFELPEHRKYVIYSELTLQAYQQPSCFTFLHL